MSFPLRALLIGISDYSPNRLPDGEECPNLEGAVPDVDAVEAFLRERLDLAPERTLKLTAQPGGPPEPLDRRPTHDNIVKAFQRLASEADPGDPVYIHYSGHGARLPTQFPELKGRGGFDEALVPCDICRPGASYLLDVELAALVRSLVDRELLLTLVLDCCHSGGAIRDGYVREVTGSVARGLGEIARSSQPATGVVASREKLMEIWGEETRQQAIVRVTEGVSGWSWLPDSRDYVLLAACQPDELANEALFENGERHGALTYWLLHTLQTHGAGLSCKEVHERVYARVRGNFPRQAPLLFGRKRRRFLGIGRVTRQQRNTVTVMRLDPERGVLLNTGQAQGVRKGDRFAVKRSRAGSDQVVVRKILLEVRLVGAVDSWTVVSESDGGFEIEPGDQATYLGPGPLRLGRGVSLIWQELPAEIDQEHALEMVRRALGEYTTGFVHLAAEGEVSDFHVAVNRRGGYEIREASGEGQDLTPLPISSGRTAVRELVRRLEHLAKFRNVEQLRNPAPDPLIAGAIEVRFSGNPMLSTLELFAGQSTTLHVINRGSDSLNVVMLDLAPDGSITQFFPKSDHLTFWQLAPGACQSIELPLQLPKRYREGKHVLKIFATLGAASFRWLEMPPLDKKRSVGVKRGKPDRDFADPFALMATNVAATRKRALTPSESSEEEWITCQVTLYVRRRPPTPAKAKRMTHLGSRVTARRKSAAPAGPGGPVARG